LLIDLRRYVYSVRYNTGFLVDGLYNPFVGTITNNIKTGSNTVQGILDAQLPRLQTLMQDMYEESSGLDLGSTLN